MLNIQRNVQGYCHFAYIADITQLFSALVGLLIAVYVSANMCELKGAKAFVFEALSEHESVEFPLM